MTHSDAGLVSRLRALSGRHAEAMPKRERINELVHAALEAATLIEQQAARIAAFDKVAKIARDRCNSIAIVGYAFRELITHKDSDDGC